MGPVTRFICGHEKIKGNHFEKKTWQETTLFQNFKDLQTPKYDFSTPKELPWH